MPTEVIEQPPQVEPVPEPQKPLTMKAGDKFRAAFEKLPKDLPEPKPEVAEPPKEEPKQVEEPKPEPVKEAPPPTEEKKPESPIDVVTADKKPEEKVEEDDDGFDENKTDWKRANQLIKERKKEIKTLKGQIDELKKAPQTDPEDIARLTKEREDLKASLAEREELIKSVDIRLSDEYRTTLSKRDKALSKVVNTAKSYGADADMLIAATALPIGKYRTDQIKASLENVEPEDRTDIRVLLKEVDDHNEALAEFERDAPKKYEEIQAKREKTIREQQEEAVKGIKSGFAKIVEELPNTLITARIVPDDVPGGTEWNETIRRATEKAERVMTPGGSDFKETGEVAWKGSHYDDLLAMYLKDHSENLDMRKRLAEYDGGGPDFKGGEKPKTEAKLTPVQKYFKTLEAAKSSGNE